MTTGADLYMFWSKSCEYKAPDGSDLPPFERLDIEYQKAWQTLAESPLVTRATGNGPPDPG